MLKHLHTTFCVCDLEVARWFYGEVLGLIEVVDRPFSFPGIWYDLGNAQLHLILDPNFKAATVNSEMENKWGRSPHLALAVDDLAALQRRCIDAGYAVQASASGRAALFVRDRDGNTIELTSLKS